MHAACGCPAVALQRHAGWTDGRLSSLQGVASARSVAQVKAGCAQFLRATTLQCLRSGLPGAQALQQHVLRLLDTGLAIARCLADPPVSCWGPLASLRWQHVSACAAWELLLTGMAHIHPVAKVRCRCVQADAPAAAAQLQGLQGRWGDSLRAVQNFAGRPFEVVRAMQLPELMLQLDLNGYYQRAAHGA